MPGVARPRPAGYPCGMPGRSWKGHAPKLCGRCGASMLLVERCSCEGKPLAAAPAGDRFLAIEGVVAHVGDRALNGSAVLREEGVFLFIERCEERRSLASSLLHAALDRLLGVFGGLLVKALERREEEASPPPGARPAEEFRAFYDRALAEAPGILRSRWCLRLSRSAVVAATFRGAGLLELSVPGREVELWADFGGRGAPAFLESAGYPVARRPPAVGKKLALAAVAVLAALAIVRELSDLQQAADWAAPKVGAAAVAAVDAKGTISVVMNREGKRFYVVDGREVPESELSWSAKAWFHWREIILTVIFGLGGAAIGLWAILRRLD